MFDLTIDKEKNRLNIVFKDYFDSHQAEQFYSRVREIIPQLKKGYIVLTDLSLLSKMDIEAKTFIEKTMDLLNQSGVARIIRVIPDGSKDIGFNIMSLFHYSSGVSILTYKSYQQADIYFQTRDKE